LDCGGVCACITSQWSLNYLIQIDFKQLLSQAWALLWTGFPCGPDWITERSAAEQAVDDWRELVLHNETEGARAIIDVLCDAQTDCTNGFRRHTGTDFLHLQALFPGALARFVCSDEERYQHFKLGMGDYMAKATTDAFKRRVCGESNSINPFAYNYTAAHNYYSSYVLVFRKKWVQVPRELYNCYIVNGLLDSEHVIGTSLFFLIKWKLLMFVLGEPYSFCTSDLTDKEFKRVEVFYRKDLDAYTIIRAEAPDGWKDGEEVHPHNYCLEVVPQISLSQVD
jgi:hypothetical protein